MLTDHEKGLDILTAVANILAEVPGSLTEHQKRLNSVEFLNI